ncbi:MAG: hypothetical protein ACD_45C00737G0001, partial [uncultured bacterium]
QTFNVFTAETVSSVTGELRVDTDVTVIT